LSLALAAQRGYLGRTVTHEAQAESDEARYAAKIAVLVSKYGEVPPPWAYYPRVHPFDMHWRMGGGEDYLGLFSTWQGSLGWELEERTAYVRRWDPPFSWLDWVARFLWPDDLSEDVDEPSEEHFIQLAALGLGNREDWLRCSEVEPRGYPLDDDTCSRWLEDERAS